jgi:hypothetical protein
MYSGASRSSEKRFHFHLSIYAHADAGIHNARNKQKYYHWIQNAYCTHTDEAKLTRGSGITRWKEKSSNAEHLSDCES